MLESNRVHLRSKMEEIKEKSTKLIHNFTLRSSASRSSSCKSLVASNSKSSSMWTEFKNDLLDDYGGMDSGSHSFTLGRLYAWEKKLYQEVKGGDSIRKIYEQKFNQLLDQDARGDEGQSVDKTRAVVKDLYSIKCCLLWTLQKAENRIFSPKVSDRNPELDTERRAQYLHERRDVLDDFQMKVNVEKEKHQNCMQETPRITLNGFQTGFGRVFEALTDFSKASLKMYQDLVNYREDAKKDENPIFIEESLVQKDGRSR